MALVGVDAATAKHASLKLLQRKDPSVVDILGQASHTAIYVFDASTQTWVSETRQRLTEVAIRLLNQISARIGA